MSGPGRPSSYTPELAAEICRRLAMGETLRAICRDDHMPDERTVRTWALDDVNGFSPQYAKAREIGYHGMFDQVLEIADTPEQGVITTRKRAADGAMYDETKCADMIEHRRLQVDARKWMLAKALPKVYGDKVQVDGDHTVKLDGDNTTPLELARGLAFVLALGKREAGTAPAAPAAPPMKH